MNFDWNNPTIQGVLLAGGLALVAAIVSAIAGYKGATHGARAGAAAARDAARLVQQEAQADRELSARDAQADRDAAREADVRRWDLEETSRRRRRGEEVALLVRDELLAATHELTYEAGRARSAAEPSEEGEDEQVGRRPRRLTLPPDEEVIKGRTERATRLLIEIPEPAVREFVLRTAEVLDDLDTVAEWGNKGWTAVGPLVAGEVETLIGAYVRGEALPATPEVDGMAAAVREYWAIDDENQRAAEEEWRAEREAKIKAEQASKAAAAAHVAATGIGKPRENADTTPQPPDVGTPTA